MTATIWRVHSQHYYDFDHNDVDYIRGLGCFVRNIAPEYATIPIYGNSKLEFHMTIKHGELVIHTENEQQDMLLLLKYDTKIYREITTQDQVQIQQLV